MPDQTSVPAWRVHLECGHTHYYFVARRLTYCLTCNMEVNALSAVNMAAPGQP